MKYSLTISFFVLIVTVIFVLVFLVPKYQNFRDTLLDFRVKKTELDNLQANLQYLQSIDNELKKKGESVKKLDTALPDREHLQQSRLLYFLEKTAKDCGLLILSISFGDPRPMKGKEQKRIFQREIIFEAEGPYSSFKNFLQKIENSSFLIEVTSINIAKGGEEENLFNYLIKTKVFSYH